MCQIKNDLNVSLYVLTTSNLSAHMYHSYLAFCTVCNRFQKYAFLHMRHGVLYGIYAYSWVACKYSQICANVCKLLGGIPPFTQIDAFSKQLCDDMCVYYNDGLRVQTGRAICNNTISYDLCLCKDGDNNVMSLLPNTPVPDKFELPIVQIVCMVITRNDNGCYAEYHVQLHYNGCNYLVVGSKFNLSFFKHILLAQHNISMDMDDDSSYECSITQIVDDSSSESVGSTIETHTYPLTDTLIIELCKDKCVELQS